MNKRKLVGLMYEHGDTQATLAKVLGISVQRLNAKINCSNGAEFNQGEIQLIKNRYELNAQMVDSIFFAQFVS